MAKKTSISLLAIDHVLFDGTARKTFVEGVLQDIKGYFETKTDGLVEVTYSECNLKGHEFGFKLHVVKSENCKKQMFSEAASAIVNAVNYMFQGDSGQYDIAVSMEDTMEDAMLEVEFVSNW